MRSAAADSLLWSTADWIAGSVMIYCAMFGIGRLIFTSLRSGIALIFVACAGGITMFDVRPGHFRRLGNYIIGRNTLSIIIDESTQFIYLPVPSAGDRPTLYIAKYNPRGV